MRQSTQAPLAMEIPCDLLIVDDDPEVLLSAELVLKKSFRSVFTASDPADIRRWLTQRSFDVVLLDMNFSAGETSGREGMHWLKVIRSMAPTTQVVLITAYGDIEVAVRAIREGAADFVVKPWDNAKLIATVSAVSKLARADREVASLRERERTLHQHLGAEVEPLIGDSAGMREVLRSIDRVAQTDANVLILGENGTGKELVARAIHRQSARCERAFIGVDLGAVPESLFESELFGHRRGAFTDAREDRAGRFELAAGGTLFLDEIGNLSLPMQAKLLRALESMTITRVGSDRPIKVDARVVCATNLTPEELHAPTRFRPDLLYRINTIEIHVPPLRARREDIATIAAHYLQLYARKYHRPEPPLDPAMLDRLRGYHWPGNVRELRHAIERLVIMSDPATLRLDGLPPPAQGPQLQLTSPQWQGLHSPPPPQWPQWLQGAHSPSPQWQGPQSSPAPQRPQWHPASSQGPKSLQSPQGQSQSHWLQPQVGPTATLNLQALEKQAIQQAIALNQGNLSKAAQALGVGRATLYRKMIRYGIE